MHYLYNIEMKKTILTLTLFAVCACVFAQNSIPADDPRITYIGRTEAKDGVVSFDWSGVSARIKFSGKTLKMVCNDSKNDFFNVWIDKEKVPAHDAVISFGRGDTTVFLADKLKKGVHEVIIQKRTEGEQGTMSIKAFVTDGKFLQADGIKERRIEIIGDSYSCGYGTESAKASDPFKAETENCNLTYAAILGRYFDADVQWVAHSGCGIARNYNDSPVATMTERYPNIFDVARGGEWDAGKYLPDIVVIYLGTNDFSRGKQPTFAKWTSNYTTLLNKIRSNYGEQVPILCVASKADDILGDYVREFVSHCGIKNVAWTSIQAFAHNNDSDLGASWHPNYAGHRKVACCMIPYVSTLTGWEMPDKPVL